MASNVIKEYLVALGFQLDHPQWNQFQSMLNRAGMEVRRATGGMSHEFSIAAGVIGGALASIVAGTAALLDNTAQADLNYQVFARRMFMTADSAKALKIATDALGYSLEDIIWGPKELQERYRQLIIDQRQLAQGLGGADFERQMKRLRDYRFEFTRFKVEVQYLAMGMARNLSRALFGDDDALLKRLQSFNSWFIRNLPQISRQLSDVLAPAVKDIVAIGRDLGGILRDIVSAFISFTGQVAGIDRLKSGQVTIENFALATERWLHALRNVIDVIKSIWDALRYPPDDMPDWARGLLSIPSKEAIRRQREQDSGGLGGRAGADIPGSLQPYLRGMSASRQAIQDEIRRVARELNVPEQLALSMAKEESNFNQSAVSRKGAVGVMQLMPGTAAGMGVNPNDLHQNIRGGLGYLRQMFEQYHDWNKALQAYNWGPRPGVNTGRVPPEVRGYADRIIHRTDIGGITVHVAQPNATPQEIAAAVRDGVSRVLGKRDQEHLAQFSEVYS